jgi:hypothetical protein
VSRALLVIVIVYLYSMKMKKVEPSGWSEKHANLNLLPGMCCVSEFGNTGNVLVGIEPSPVSCLKSPLDWRFPREQCRLQKHPQIKTLNE